MEKTYKKSLPFFFLTEMWERFGFYIVQGLLVLYMTEYFGFSDSESYIILGVFTALAYISPIGGGFLAARFIGYKTAIVWGGFFLILGYVLLSLPFTNIFLYPALATIIVGTGLFKPNISSLLGEQYEPDDQHRDAGFTIFYIGINVGAFLAGMSAGYIKEYFGWRMSFTLASIGLLIGLATFIYGLKYIKDGSKEPISRSLKYQLVFYIVLTIIGINFLLRIHGIANWLVPAAGVFVFMFLVVLTTQQKPPFRNRLLILNVLIISSIVFWMLYWQIFSSANLFVERIVDRDYFGVHLSSTVFWASESVFIILLGPLFALLWHRLGKQNKNPSPVSKFSLGILFTAFGFFVLSVSGYFPDSKGLVNPLWILASYLLITIGELCISPIGLSAVTMLAPIHLTGLMMGVWFLATGFGGIFSGMLAQLANIPNSVHTTEEALVIYQNAFLTYSYLAFFFAILLFFLQLALKRLLKDDRESSERL